MNHNILYQMYKVRTPNFDLAQLMGQNRAKIAILHLWRVISQKLFHRFWDFYLERWNAIFPVISENLDLVDLKVFVLWPILRAEMCQICNFDNFEVQYLKNRYIDSEILF